MTKKDLSASAAGPSLIAIVEAAQDVREAVKMLNIALKRAHDLKIVTVIVKETQTYSYGAPGGPLPSQAPQFKINRLDFKL